MYAGVGMAERLDALLQGCSACTAGVQHECCMHALTTIGTRFDAIWSAKGYERKGVWTAIAQWGHDADCIVDMLMARAIKLGKMSMADVKIQNVLAQGRVMLLEDMLDTLADDADSGSVAADSGSVAADSVAADSSVKRRRSERLLARASK